MCKHLNENRNVGRAKSRLHVRLYFASISKNVVGSLGKREEEKEEKEENMGK